MKPKSFRTIAVLSVAIALLGGSILSGTATAADSRYITISATGSTSIVPDAVRIQATVSALGKSSKEALSSVATTASAIRRALSANNIAKKDIASQSVSVYPEYIYPANETPVLSGYRASQIFEITVRAATTAGAIMETLVDSGGDKLQINSASPYVMDNDKATQAARASAVFRAKAKAMSYAKLLGLKLGRVIYLDETSTPTTFPVYAPSAKSEDSSIQIDLGEQKISISITVRWQLK